MFLFYSFKYLVYYKIYNILKWSKIVVFYKITRLSISINTFSLQSKNDLTDLKVTYNKIKNKKENKNNSIPLL